MSEVTKANALLDDMHGYRPDVACERPTLAYEHDLKLLERALADAEERGRQAGVAQLRNALRHCPHACIAPCPHHRKLDEVCAKLGIGGKDG